MLIAKSRLKNDRADAKVSGELLRSNFLPLANIPNEEIRDRKMLLNDRVRYGVRKGELMGSIRWFLKRGE